MSVPSAYQSTEDYLRDALTFLKTYQWLYNYPNTHIVSNKIIKKFPTEWLPHFKSLTNEELNNLPLGHLSINSPNSLKQFLNKIQSLKPTISKNIEQCSHKFSNNSGIGNKKVHEILSLAPLIHEVCKKSNCNFILDIGAGLGYLPQLLSEKYKYPVLAIEGSSEKIELAKKNQKKYPNSTDSVKFVEHFVTENSVDSIRNLFNETEMQSVCITGLHACADLSITILKIFTQLEFAKSLIIMPCCYHRLLLENQFDNKEDFKNFPASNLLKQFFDEFEANTFLKTPFLRLACQQIVNGFSNMTKKEHEEHSKKLLCRGILQEVAIEENYQIKRLKRKSGKCKCTAQSEDDDDFENYLSNLKYSYALIMCDKDLNKQNIEMSDVIFLNKMREKWFDYKNDCDLIEVLTGLQASIQSICENIILLDRTEFLKEKGLHCVIEKVTDDRISPRCYALVATKL